MGKYQVKTNVINTKNIVAVIIASLITYLFTKKKKNKFKIFKKIFNFIIGCFDTVFCANLKKDKQKAENLKKNDIKIEEAIIFDI